MAGFLRDVVVALRALRRNRAFAATAILTLALGIALTTAIFSVTHAVLFRPLGLPDEDRLVILRQSNPAAGIVEERVSPANFVDWEAQTTVFENMGFACPGCGGFSHVVWPDRIERVPSANVSSGFFRVLGVRPLLGRTFSAEEDRLPDQKNIVVSSSFWKERFNGAPDILSRSVQIETSFRGGGPRTIIGVMPEGFDYPEGVDIWLPSGVTLPLPAANAADRCCPFLDVIGRLRPGATSDQARAQLDTVVQRLSEQYPAMSRVRHVTVTPLHEHLVGHHRPALAVLFGAVACVLLIACANVANLLLSRGVTRRPEIALRMALGAQRSRLIRQLCAEGLVLSAAGAILGALGAVFVRRVVIVSLEGRIPMADGARVDLPVLAFVGLLMAVSAVLFGLAPATQMESPKWLVRDAGQRRESHRLRSALVMMEIALAVTLLAGAGLFMRTLMALEDVNPGFRPAQVLSVSFDLSTSAFRGPGNQQPYFFELMQRVAALPGVEVVAGASHLPLSERVVAVDPITLDGHPVLAASDSPRVAMTAVTPSYFSAVGIPLLRGRVFSEGDRSDGKLVAVLNETAARRYWPGQDPIGKRLYVGSRERNQYFRAPSAGMEPEWREIVGIVGDVKNAGLEAPPEPELYFNYRQHRWYAAALLVRGRGDPGALIAPIREAARAVHRNAVIINITTLEQILADATAEPAHRFKLTAAFSVISLLLAALGIYGIFSYLVAQRTREIGIRVALGATAGHVIRTMLARVLTLALVGVAFGLVGVVLLARWLSGLLYGVSAVDPVALGGSCLLLFATALAAGYLPARRAARVDPLVALREL